MTDDDVFQICSVAVIAAAIFTLVYDLFVWRAV